MAINDTKRIILAAAAARTDLHVLPIPESLKVNTATIEKTITQMIGARLVAEVAAASGDAVWRHTEETGKIALVVTPTGLAAIGVEGGDTAPPATPRTRRKAKPARTKPAKKAQAAHGATSGASRANAGKRRAAPSTAGKSATRGSVAAKQSKQDLVVAMLRRGGASIADLAEATGWQQHSVRGVLTATIKGRLNLPLVSEKGEDGVRRYHIAALRSDGGEK